MIHITKTHSISSPTLKLIDDLNIPTYVHSVLDSRDMKMVDRGIKTKIHVILDKLFNNHDLSDTFAHGRSGLIYAAGNTTSSGFICDLVKQPDHYPTTKNHALSLHNILMGYIANRIGLFDHLSVDGSACISHTAAMKYGKLLIDSGELDRVLVVSAEDGSSNELLEFFCKNKVCNTVDTFRDTFFLGEGASYTVLENDTSLEKTKNKPIAELVNVFTRHEEYSNPIGIDPIGSGYRWVIQKALACSNNVMDIVRLHDTGTSDNEIELKIINELIPNVKTLSYKKTIGHTLGSCSGIELDLTLNSHTGTIAHLSAGMGNVFGVIVTKT